MNTNKKHDKNVVNGAFVVAFSYLLWGILPLYWKLLAHVSAISILANRIIWSLVFTAILIYFQSRWEELKSGINSRKELLHLFSRSFFIGSNWLIFIWGINNGHVLECSLGYFINPLMTVFLGCVFLKESLNKYQIVALILTSIGVLLLIFNYGYIPWISLLVAVTFAFYSLLKKTSTSEALTGLTAEVAILTVPALIYLAVISIKSGSLYFLQESLTTNILLILSGIVTAVPLLLFANGIRKIRLSLAGPLQYIAPTCTFLLGVFVFKENFTRMHLISFIIIWLSLVIFSCSSLPKAKKYVVGEL